MRFALLALVALGLAGCARSDVIDPRPTPGTSSPDAGPPDAGSTDAGPCDSNGWRGAGSVSFDSASAHAVTLLSGKVLVVGDDVAETALFDPANHTWSPTGAMASVRGNFTLTLLSDGKVLLAGGAGLGTPPPEQIYEPTGGQFRTTGSLQTGHVNAAAVRLDDGRVLLVGGMGAGATPTYLQEAELYAPAAGTWSNAARLPQARENLTLTLLKDGTVLAAGGDAFTDPDPNAKADAWRYDPRANHWTPVGPLGHARTNHTATLLPDGRVLIAGGLKHLGSPDPLYATELFDPQTNSFADGPSLHHARYAHVAHLLPSGSVLLVGGFQEGGNHEYPESEELYDPVANAVHNVGRLLEPRAYPASALIGSQVLVVTGIPIPARATFLSSAEIFGCP